MRISFWRKETGNFLTHKDGLTREQVAELQKLKPGDRLILWAETSEEATKPDLNLKIFLPKEQKL